MPRPKMVFIFGRYTGAKSADILKVWAYSEGEATIRLANELSHNGYTKSDDAKKFLDSSDVLGPVSEAEFRGAYFREYAVTAKEYN